MRRALQVFLRGDRRVTVAGLRRESALATALEAWLAERIEVVRIERRDATRGLDVVYDDGAAVPGCFLRALRDRIHALEEPPAVPFDVAIVHSLPGRVRLRVLGVTERQTAALATLVAVMPGVLGVRHLPGSTTILLIYDPARSTEDAIVCALRKLDLAPEEWQRPTGLRWGGALCCTGVLLTCLARAAPFPALAAGVVCGSLRPLHRSVIGLTEGKISIDLLDVAATFAALATRRPVTAAFVIWMVGVGDLLLDVSANNARSAISTLIQHREQETEVVLADGHPARVRVRLLERGDRLVVRTGQVIAADGRILSGLAEIDEKALTGESRLLVKEEGARVFASTVVVSGRIVVEVEQSGRSTQAAGIERILGTIGSKPLLLQRDALELASRLVVPTFGVAALAAILSSDVTRAICILITDFGTGIRIAVPVSALIAMTLAAKRGILVKGAQYLERLSRADVIVFDKTGTLTHGDPEVIEVVTAHGTRESTLLRLAASAESGHEHPLAKALRVCARRRGIALVSPEAGSEQYSVGRGVAARLDGHRVQAGRPTWLEAEGLSLRTFRTHLRRLEREQISTLCVAIDGRVVGLVGYSDGTRPESSAIVRRLRAGGRRRVVLLSGDAAPVAAKVARELGIDEAVGGLLPDDKAEYVRRLQAAGHIVAMVGDGINDAPALARADVGISIAGSTDVAIETADVILLEGGLSRLECAFRLSEQAMGRVQQNLGVVIVPNAIAIALGALGYITPAIAAVVNNGATLLAVLVGTAPLLNAPRRQRERALHGGGARQPTAAA